MNTENNKYLNLHGLEVLTNKIKEILGLYIQKGKNFENSQIAVVDSENSCISTTGFVIGNTTNLSNSKNSLAIEGVVKEEIDILKDKINNSNYSNNGDLITVLKNNTTEIARLKENEKVLSDISMNNTNVLNTAIKSSGIIFTPQMFILKNDKKGINQKLFIGVPNHIDIFDIELKFVKISKVLERPYITEEDSRDTIKKYYGIHTIRNISSISDYTDEWKKEEDLIQLKLGKYSFTKENYDFYEVLGKVLSSDDYSIKYIDMLQYINIPHEEGEHDYFLPINYKNQNGDYLKVGDLLKRRKCGIIVISSNKIISNMGTFRTQYDDTNACWKLKVSRGQ